MRDADTTPLWRWSTPLVLASGSATRALLLTQAGVPFTVIRPAVDERSLEANLVRPSPETVALALASAKAVEVSHRQPERLVLGADQTLHCGETSFHKAITRAEALDNLMRLSGRRHRLTSAFALARQGEIVESGVGTADLTMRALTRSTLETYLDVAGETVLGSVGCYQLEGLGAHLFEAVSGDHFTILGLPLLPLLKALRRLGALHD